MNLSIISNSYDRRSLKQINRKEIGSENISADEFYQPLVEVYYNMIEIEEKHITI